MDEVKPGSKQARHRKKRRATGLCAYEGCETTSGESYYCDTHRMARNWKQRGRRAGVAQ